jgi:hypothetical protein
MNGSAKTRNACESGIDQHGSRMYGDDPTMDDMNQDVAELSRAISKPTLTQWASSGDRVFYAVGEVAKTLEPGAYMINAHNDNIFFMRFDFKIGGLMRFPDTISDQIIDEIQKFWDLGDHFSRYGITHRRGIMTYGPTGSGKSSTNQIVAADVIKRGGVVIPFTGATIFLRGMEIFRTIQPNTPVVVLMEDLDAIMDSGNSSEIMNILDGTFATMEHVVFLADTNYPERLERRVTNRPSRFDRCFKMELPVAETRRLYLESLRRGDQFDIERAVNDSDGFSFAHLKELFTATVIFGRSYDETITSLRSMIETALPTGADLEDHGRGHMGLLPKHPRHRFR